MTRDEIIELANSCAGQHFMDEAHIQRFAALVAEAEREAIHAEWATRMQSDLEHGVKWMNEIATENWHSNYRKMSGFGEWLAQREEK
jgi:hypothetical protein